MLFAYYMFLTDFSRDPRSIEDYFDGLCARAIRIELENPEPSGGVPWR